MSLTMKYILIINAFIWMPIVVLFDFIFWNVIFGSFDYRGIKEIFCEHAKLVISGDVNIQGFAFTVACIFFWMAFICGQ